jgi:predicted lysophospholipase L1 biosynthesis ABC-type transport system permease subunit
MEEKQDHLKDLSEIRSLMERSSRFLSLSGLSGIFAGLFALGGAAAAYVYFNWGLFSSVRYYEYADNRSAGFPMDFYTFFALDAMLVLGLSLGVGFFFTQRKAKKAGLKVWDKTAKLMLTNLFIPLAVGAAFCLIMLHHGVVAFVAPATLVFYGLALLNASKYTFNDIRYLGICEIGLGLIALYFIDYGLLFWALGFGVLHIIYGAAMYYKYER